MSWWTARLLAGVEASWRGWSWCEPFVRYTNANGIEWQVIRFEIGIDLRFSEVIGVQFAYAQQICEMDKVFVNGDIGRVETDGMHIGLSLRF